MNEPWSESTLGDFAPFTYGSTLKAESRDGGIYPVFGSNGVVGSHSEGLVKSPMIVVGRKGSAGVVTWAPEGGWPIDTTFYVTGSTADRNLRFAYYLMKTLGLHNMNSDSAVPGLNRDRAHVVPIRVPNIAEQEAIVTVLGSIDDLIDRNNRLMQALEDLSSAVFRRAWDGSSVIQLQDLGQLTMGQSPPGESLNEKCEGTVFYQGVRDFGDRFPTARVYTTDSKRLAERGSILIAVRAPVGDTNVVLEDVSIGRGLAAIKSKRPATLLRSLRAVASTWAAHQGTGTVFSSISGSDLKQLKVPHVDSDDLETELAFYDDAYEKLHLENLSLIAARDELLPLLISGLIRVRTQVDVT